MSVDQPELLTACKICHRPAAITTGITAMCRHEHRVHFIMCVPCGRAMTIERFERSLARGICVTCRDALDGNGHRCAVRHHSGMLDPAKPSIYVGEL